MGDPSAVLPPAIAGFERTVIGLNGPVAGGGHRRAAARTFITMGPGPRRALVDVVIRADSQADAALVLAGARSGSSTPLAVPPGAAESGGSVITFRRGVWVATLTMSPASADAATPSGHATPPAVPPGVATPLGHASPPATVKPPIDDHLLIAAALAQAALLPPPTHLDLGALPPSGDSGSSPAVAIVGVGAVFAAAILAAGLLVVRRRMIAPRPIVGVHGAIPASLPPLPAPASTARWSTTRTAGELGVSPDVVRRLVASGRLTPEREGRAYRFDPDQVRALAARRRPRP